MNRKFLIASAGAVILGFGAAGASADTFILGPVTQSNSQAVNCSQSASNGAGGTGTTVVLGSSSPTLTQTCVNVVTNTQLIGASDVVYGRPLFAGFALRPAGLAGSGITSVLTPSGWGGFGLLARDVILG